MIASKQITTRLGAGFARAHGGLRPAWENAMGGTGVWAATPDGEWAGGAIVADKP